MNGRRSVIGLAMLCVLALSALATAHASAGGRANLCVEGGNKDYAEADKHCVFNVGKGNGVRGHELIPRATRRAILATNANTAAGTIAAQLFKVKGKISGIATEIQCTTVNGEGELENSETFASGTGTIESSGCTVTLPAGRECKVGNSGVITSKPLAMTTAGLGANELKVEMGTGQTELASIRIEGCKNNAPPTANYPLAGSLIATTSGGTATTLHAEITTQGTLTFGGNAAGFEGAVTFKLIGTLVPVTFT